ncbi:MAG: hypothetical protein VW438_03620, partial [Euryarchaeota archaeon]
ELPVPPAPERDESSSQAEPEQESEPKPDDESETPDNDSEPKSRLVQQDCSQCQQRFEVTLPEGHDIARTACPSCGAIETVRLS